MHSGWLKEEWEKKQQAVIDATNEAYTWATIYNIAKDIIEQRAIEGKLEEVTEEQSNEISEQGKLSNGRS